LDKTLWWKIAAAQVAAFGSVALYAAYYVGEAKLEASTLYIVVGALAAVWAVSFGVLLLTCLFVAHKSADEFGLVICAGFTAQIFFHVYQNIGMTIAIMPITGLPLPLISYGGTFLLMNNISLGLVNSVWIHRKDIV
jgi:hypothetical protein